MISGGLPTTSGITKTINNAPTSNTKVGGSGDLQHMLAMMQQEQTTPLGASNISALNRIGEKTSNLNSIVSGNAPKTTSSFLNTVTAAPNVDAASMNAINNATVAPATMQQELADMQAATTQPATQATTTQTTQAATPAITVSAPSVNSYKSYIDDVYAAQREAALSALEAEYNAAIGELERQKAALGPAYQSARNQTAGVNAQESRAMNEIYNAAGLSSGGRVQGAIAQSNVLQSELGALQQAETQALAEIESQRTQVAAQYQAKVREAIMNNEMQKAAALYDEAIRYDNAMTSAAKESAKETLNAAKEKAEMLASIGDFSGYLALGYTPEQVAAFEAAYIEATKPKYSGGGGVPKVNDYYALLADLGVSDSGTAYQILIGQGLSDTEATKVASGYVQNIGSPNNEQTYTGTGNPLKNSGAIQLYGTWKNGLMSAEQTAAILNDYRQKKLITDEELDYILAEMGY